MSIDARCREQQPVADRIFMDFKYTRPGSKEQLQALSTLSFLIGMWADFLTACLLYTSPSPRDKRQSRMPSSA